MKASLDYILLIVGLMALVDYALAQQANVRSQEK